MDLELQWALEQTKGVLDMTRDKRITKCIEAVMNLQDVQEVNEVIEAIKQKQNYLASQARRKFIAGDTVQFTSRNGQTYKGTVDKIKQDHDKMNKALDEAVNHTGLAQNKGKQEIVLSLFGTGAIALERSIKEKIKDKRILNTRFRGEIDC